MSVLGTRAFLRNVAAVGGVGSLTLPGCGSAAGVALPPMSDGAVLEASLPAAPNDASADLRDAGPPTPEQLYGGKLGRRQVYLVHAPDGGRSGCTTSDDAGTTTYAEIVRAYDAGGMQGFDVIGPCGSQETNVRVHGSDVEQLLENVWQALLKAPVVADANWDSVPPYRFGWQPAGSVTVRAGTFQDCWLRKSLTDRLLDTVYCPGVGRISMVTETYAIELQSVTP